MVAIGERLDGAKRGLADGRFGQPPLTHPNTLAYVA
jgi:hypothetical protein